MKKEIKLIITTILIATIMLSGAVMASSNSNAMFNGMIKAISFGQHILYGDSEPILSITQTDVSYTKTPEAIRETIAVLVTTENVPDNTPLVVKLLRDGIAMDENDYAVIDNIVNNNSARISVMLDVDMEAQEYTLQISNEENTLTDSVLIVNRAIVIETKAIYLEKGESIILQYYTIPDTMQNSELVFTSEDEEVAVVSPEGLLTAVEEGETTITISTEDEEIQASCVVYVVEKSIIIQELTTTPESLKAGEEGQINLKISAQGFVSQEQLDIQIIKNGEDVTNNFTIQGNEVQSNEVNLIIIPNTELVKSGLYTIFVSYDGKEIEEEKIENQIINFVIEANNPVTGLVADKLSTIMQIGEQKTIQVTISPEDADNKKILWYSNNENVVVVDENGQITAENKGTAIIRAASDENPTIYVEISVRVQENLVETEEFIIDNNTHIINHIPENVTAESFLNNISIDADEYQLVNKNDEELSTTDLVGTGSKLIVGDQEYLIIVTGDTNGDGKITITDVSQVKLHFIGLELLSELGQEAADTNHDNDITITDVSQIKLHFIRLELLRP